MSKIQRLCKNDCNNCEILNGPNYRHLTLIFNALYAKFGDGVYEIIQYYCPNMTCCADCHIDDFTHMKQCEIIKIMKINEKERKKS